MATQAEIREQITSRIVEALKAGTPPGGVPGRTWRTPAAPPTWSSKRSYSGVNTLLLQLCLGAGLVEPVVGDIPAVAGTRPPRQGPALARQARASGGRGSSSGKAVAKKPAHERNGQDHPATSEEHDSRFSLLRTYCVFHAEQVEGDGIERYLARPRTTHGLRGLPTCRGGHRRNGRPHRVRRQPGRVLPRGGLHPAAAQGRLREPAGVLRDRVPRACSTGGPRRAAWTG